MQKTPRRIQFTVDEHSLVPREQLDARGFEITDVTLTHPITGKVPIVSIPKVPSCCPRCGQPKQEAIRHAD